MTKKNILTILLSLGMISLSFQSFDALAQATPDTSSGVAVFTEDFDNVNDSEIPSGWEKEGDWGVAFAGEDFGKVLYGDYFNIPYTEQLGARIVSPTIDLGGASSATIGFTTRCDTEYAAGTDHMKILASGDGTSFEDLLSWNEATIDTDGDSSGRAFDDVIINVPSNLLSENSKIAFEWTANSSDNDYDGCIVDDIVVTRNGTGGEDPIDDEEETDEDDNSTGTTTDETDNEDDGTGTTTDQTGNDDNDTGTTTDETGNDDDIDETAIPISSCMELTDAGSTYRLTQDITTEGTCLTISSDDITVDGGGFTISGDRGVEDYAIFADTKAGISIENITVENFDYGMRFVESEGLMIDSATFTGNNYGLVLHGGTNITVQNSNAENNAVAGIYLSGVTNSTVTGNTANNNEIGINLDGSDNNTVSQNTATQNDRGILLLDSHDNVIESNTSNDNFFGIVVEMISSRNTLTNNATNQNQVGIALGGGNNTIEGSQIDGSQVRGIQFFEGDSFNNVIRNTSITNTNAQGNDIVFAGAGPNSTAAAVDGTVFVNTPISSYVITPPGGTITIANNNGEVTFTEDVSGTGENLSSDIVIENGRIVLSEAFDSAATITFENLQNALENPVVLKDDIQCENCQLVSNTSSGIQFSVTGAGEYQVDGDISTSTDSDDGNGTGTTTDGEDNGTDTTTDETGNGTTTDETDDEDDGTGTTTDQTDDEDGGTGTTTDETGNDDNDTGTTTDETGNNGTTTDETNDDDSATTTDQTGNNGTTTDETGGNNSTTTPETDNDSSGGNSSDSDDDEDDNDSFRHSNIITKSPRILTGRVLGVATTDIDTRLFPQEIETRIGDIFSVSVIFDPANLENSEMGMMKIAFPSELFTVVGFNLGEELSAVNGTGYDLIDNVNGVVIKTAQIPEGTNDETLFGTILFTAKQNGSGEIVLADESFDVDITSSVSPNASEGTLSTSVDVRDIPLAAIPVINVGGSGTTLVQNQDRGGTVAGASTEPSQIVGIVSNGGSSEITSGTRTPATTSGSSGLIDSEGNILGVEDSDLTGQAGTSTDLLDDTRWRNIGIGILILIIVIAIIFGISRSA